MNNRPSNDNVFSANDALDINELASLNDDISPEFIEQLQNQVAQNASKFTGRSFIDENDDSQLFEETATEEEQQEIINPIEIKPSEEDDKEEEEEISASVTPENVSEDTVIKIEENSSDVKEDIENNENATENSEIENLTSGNIVEKPFNQAQLDYKESLDYLDENVKYSKYVIYVNPENKDFIDSLTVKERKNLINKLLREQDDITITKRRLALIQTVIKHAIIAIITISIAIPIVYWTINSSLEASINNYRRSKTIFKTLYREKGKIKTNNRSY